MDHRNFLAPLARGLAPVLLALGLAGAAVAAPAVSAERQRLAEAYFRVGGFENVYSNPERIHGVVTAQMRAMEASMAERMTPQQRADFRRGLEAAAPDMKRIIGEAVTRMRPDMVKALAATYSEDELRALVTFYQSPVGRSVAAKNERLMQAMAEVGGRHTGKMMMQLEQALAAKVRPAANAPAKGK